MATTSTTTSTSKVKQEFVKIEALVVKSVAKSFRRIGLAFTREATHLDPSLLTTAQVAELKSDPNLTVTTASVMVVAPTGTPATAVVTPVQEPASGAAAE